MLCSSIGQAVYLTVVTFEGSQVLHVNLERKWNTNDISLLCHEVEILNKNRLTVCSPEGAMGWG